MGAFEPAEWARDFLKQPLSDSHRPIRLRLAGDRQARFRGPLLVQRIDIVESICGGIRARITCLSTQADNPLAAFIGLPIEVQLVNDRGGLHRLCCIVTDVQAGQSDGGLAVFQLTGRDGLAVMERRINSRVFRARSPVEIGRIMIDEWLQRGHGLARAFTLDDSGLGLQRYPEREFTMQYNESDADFLRRLWKRNGIGWVIEPASPRDDTPQHRLVLFDDSRRLQANEAGELRYHRDAATEPRDGITAWAPARQLVTGQVERRSWDYRQHRVLHSMAMPQLDQGASGNGLAGLLNDSHIEMPHAADDSIDHERLTHLRLLRHASEGACIKGVSGVRDLAAGQWSRISGHSSLEGKSLVEREYLFVEVHHFGENNLPKQLDERAQALLSKSECIEGWRPAAARGAADRRYQNRFIAVQRDARFVPSWHPQQDLPRMHPLTAVVVGPKGSEVHCDELGRVKLQFLGLDPADHAHAAGAGSNGNDGDSAWVRVNFGWAGPGFGNIQPLRAAMEVLVDFLGGDPDRPIVTGAMYNGYNPPPSFSDCGALPRNRYLSGTKTREVDGRRYNQLRFDDTPGQISAQLESGHGHSQLNLGWQTQPRSSRATEPRGEGAELRSDESVAIRSGKALLISAWKRLEACDGQLARHEYESLMQECLELFKSLGQYAAQHQGPVNDAAPQSDLKADIERWEAGSNTDEEGQDGGAPVIGITAPGGISLATPKTLAQYAGLNVDIVAQQHLQYTAGQQFSLNAGQGVGLFAHHGGFRAIAHQGPMNLQSQHDSTAIDSAQDITMRAVGDITLTARSLTLIAEDGSYIKLGGGITLGTNDTIARHAASFTNDGPQTMSGSKPSFAKGEPDGRFVLRFDPRDKASAVAARQSYRVALNDGTSIEGISDENGLTSLTQRQAMQIAAVTIFKKG